MEKNSDRWSCLFHPFHNHIWTVWGATVEATAIRPVWGKRPCRHPPSRPPSRDATRYPRIHVEFLVEWTYLGGWTRHTHCGVISGKKNSVSKIYRTHSPVMKAKYNAEHDAYPVPSDTGMDKSENSSSLFTPLPWYSQPPLLKKRWTPPLPSSPLHNLLLPSPTPHPLALNSSVKSPSRSLQSNHHRVLPADRDESRE